MRRSKRLGRLRPAALAAGAVVLIATAAWAGETIRYAYDARGRLVKVVRTDPATNTVTATTEYAHDRADNRTRRETK